MGSSQEYFTSVKILNIINNANKLLPASTWNNRTKAHSNKIGCKISFMKVESSPFGAERGYLR
jgi:hypothetical protein